MLRLVCEWLWDVHGLTCQEATRLAAPVGWTGG